MKAKRGLQKKAGRSINSTKTPSTLRKGAVGVRKAVKTSPKQPKKRLKLEQKSAQQLQKPADKEFSRYVRLRDSTLENGVWVGTCITCTKTGTVAWHDGKKLRFTSGWDAGHFIERGILSIRYEEENVNLQCAFHCNKMKSGNHEKYKGALDEKYGSGTYRKLENLAKLPESRRRLPKPELLQIIHDSKVQCELYERMMNGKEEG